MNKYLSNDCILSFIHIFFAKVEYFSCFVYNYFFLAEIFLVFYNVFNSYTSTYRHYAVLRLCIYKNNKKTALKNKKINKKWCWVL